MSQHDGLAARLRWLLTGCARCRDDLAAKAGLRNRTFGAAVYAKPEFVSGQRLNDFFTCATRPDNRAYKDFRRFLLETSQVPGGFYSRRGRRQLLRHVTDMMLSPLDPYDALKSGTAAPRQQLRAVT